MVTSPDGDAGFPVTHGGHFHGGGDQCQRSLGFIILSGIHFTLLYDMTVALIKRQLSAYNKLLCILPRNLQADKNGKRNGCALTILFHSPVKKKGIEAVFLP
jgi:hypothetical protein